MRKKITAFVHPIGSLDVLSQYEVNLLSDSSHKELQEMFRLCSLAVLNSGSQVDNCKDIIEQHNDYQIEIHQTDRGVKLKVVNAPSSAFVDGQMIAGIQEHLFSVLRDLIYSHQHIVNRKDFDFTTSEGITNANFHILRNSGVLIPAEKLNLVVCWGGHAISRIEYDYTKEVGYQLGLRAFDICTGCGPGAMKGPMKGAALAHAKQRIKASRFIGISEPGIIAAEAPNPIVNQLIIMPDIEKRLESFVRLSHGIIIFPGGAGTAEELLYLLGLLLHPENMNTPFPVIITGPESSRSYLDLIQQFISKTLGQAALDKYQVICGDPEKVSKEMKKAVSDVREFRKQHSDAYFFNWRLKIPYEFQVPFRATHENMSQLSLSADQPVHQLAANLRCAFSGIVAGNIKAEGVSAIEQFGPFKLQGDKFIMESLDELLRAFVKQKRMKIGSQEYDPCYELL